MTLPKHLAVLLALTSVASADPLILRGLDTGRGPAVSGGSASVSAGGFITAHLGIAVELRLPADTVGASVGGRWTLVEGKRGWGLDAFAAGGLDIPTLRPGLALTTTLALFGRVRRNRYQVALGAVSPSAVRLTGIPEARFPLLLEFWLGIRAGPVWLALQANAGAVLAPSYTPSLWTEVNGVVAVDLGRTR